MLAEKDYTGIHLNTYRGGIFYWMKIENFIRLLLTF